MANPYHSGESSESVFKNTIALQKLKRVNNDTVKIYVWELPVRIFHWINAAAIFALMITGIYIGNPFLHQFYKKKHLVLLWDGLDISISFQLSYLQLNLPVRLYWHLKGNKYATSNLLRKIFWKETWQTVKFYLFMKNKKPHFVGHNPLAQLSYWAIIGGGSIIMIFTGFYLYVEPQPESFWARCLNGYPQYSVIVLKFDHGII